MKKFLSALLCLCIVLGCSVLINAQSGDELWLRIGLKFDSTAVESCTVSCSDGFMLATGGSSGYSEAADYTAYKSLMISCTDGKIVATDASGSVVNADLGSFILMSGNQDPDSRIISIDGASYRDGVMFRAGEGSLFSVISYVQIEHYLWSVVGAEIGPSYPIEAIKAQAVAARSFAIANRSRHSAKGFDLCCKSSDCQAYHGTTKEYKSTIQACQETEGLVITYNGKAVIAYYYASSGGYTMNSEDVWTQSLGYLIICCHSALGYFNLVHNGIDLLLLLSYGSGNPVHLTDLIKYRSSYSE